MAGQGGFPPLRDVSGWTVGHGATTPPPHQVRFRGPPPPPAFHHPHGHQTATTHPGHRPILPPHLPSGVRWWFTLAVNGGTAFTHTAAVLPCLRLFCTVPPHLFGPHYRVTTRLDRALPFPTDALWATFTYPPAGWLTPGSPLLSSFAWRFDRAAAAFSRVRRVARATYTTTVPFLPPDAAPHYAFPRHTTFATTTYGAYHLPSYAGAFSPHTAATAYSDTLRAGHHLVQQQVTVPLRSQHSQLPTLAARRLTT